MAAQNYGGVQAAEGPAAMELYYVMADVLAWGTQVTADGVAARSLAVPLERNALVRTLNVQLTAAPAQAVLLGDAAQVRIQSNSSGTMELVADFGALFTVASVGALATAAGVTITSVTAWNGIGFASQPLPTLAGTTSDRVLFNEVRAERLLIKVTGAASLVPAEQLWVELPDPPSDLELRIDGGPPVWSFAGPVRPDAGGWEQGRRTVDLGPAFAALTGNPDDASVATFNLQLTSRTPGRLELAAGTRSVSHLARSRPGGTDAHDVEFEAEGLRTVPLPVPTWVEKVERVALSVSGIFPAERADPPTGPDAAAQLTYGSAVVAGGAELVLDADRAACARLPAGAALLEELTAMRVRLRAEAGGAEARVVLLAHRQGADLSSEPGDPVEGGASAPVTLEPTAAAEWTTFAFPRPIALDPGETPWAAVVVARGRAAWPLAAAPDAPLRRGAPTGPWQALPAVAGGGVGGALRVVGLAPRDRPLAPLTVGVEGSAVTVAVTPTARPVAVAWAAADAGVVPAANAVQLRLTSRAPATATLRDVIITARKKP